jgi:hypothetical protein
MFSPMFCMHPDRTTPIVHPLPCLLSLCVRGLCRFMRLDMSWVVCSYRWGVVRNPRPAWNCRKGAGGSAVGSITAPPTAPPTPQLFSRFSGPPIIPAPPGVLFKSSVGLSFTPTTAPGLSFTPTTAPGLIFTPTTAPPTNAEGPPKDVHQRVIHGPIFTTPAPPGQSRN